MNRKLTPEQIEAAYRDLLRDRRRVTVRALMTELRHRFGATGRTERVSEILHHLEANPTSERVARAEFSADVSALLERVKAAEARAARSEEIERRHQDYWAQRYAEKADALERKHIAAIQAPPAINAEHYLRLKQRVAELARRLSQYEPVEP